MKSKINVRIRHDDPSLNAEAEVTINNQWISGVTMINGENVHDVRDFPHGDDSVKDLMYWLSKDRHEAKLPSEPESAYRHIENLMQLGDLLGLGRVD